MHFWKGLFRQKIGLGFIFSSVLFLTCMSLDFYLTNIGSKGDFTLEANIVGKTWWQLTGAFRFLEIPIYAGIILGAAYVINFKSRFFAVAWLNLLAFNHLFGFLSWMPNGLLDFLYSWAKKDWQLPYLIACMSIPAGFLLAFFQTKFKLK